MLINNPPLVGVHFYGVFNIFLSIFPPFYAEKRYKLCNFAPDLEIVENYRTCLIFNKKELTAVVHNVKPHGYN